jgi:hypothetical protein
VQIARRRTRGSQPCLRVAMSNMLLARRSADRSAQTPHALQKAMRI